MATLPRASRLPTRSSDLFLRPQSEFDAGINTSAAWTEHLERGSLSDDDKFDNLNNDLLESLPTRSARSLYAFEGKPEFREVTIAAGEDIGVIREDLADGWSLVKIEGGEIGLLPRTYYTFTADFARAPDLELPPPRAHDNREASSSSITPRGSPTTGQVALPIVPQTTGEWRNFFPSFRQSLLGGKSINRFSNFVTSGAEDWVLNGSEPTEPAPPAEQRHERADSDDSILEEDVKRMSMSEADRHFVDTGPSWKTKLPPFRVIIHSPSKRSSTLSGAFTVYSVTSLFPPEVDPESDLDGPAPSPTRITVHRRFSQFVMLHTALTQHLPGIALPPLPEKQYAGRFSDDFVEARRGDLERYICRVVRHPIARYAEVVTFFLSCESDIEWKRLTPHFLTLPAAGSSFYARVYHPAFNLDAEDAAEAVERFERHTRAVGKGVQALRNTFGQIREARVADGIIEMSKADRLLSYSLLSLITSKPLASAPTTGATQEDEEVDAKGKGLMNSDGAWCWREGCEDCLKMTKAMQKTSETLRSIADLYDDHARRTQLVTHEALKGVAHPSSTYEGVVATHKSTLTRFNEATSEGSADEEMAARCETVLNTTMAEMDTYHTQKIEDFSAITKDHLDGEIAFYEQVLLRLKNARSTLDEPQYSALGGTPRTASIYERELDHPRLAAKPLLQPCPHVFDSAPMRPVSVAIQEGVGMLLGSPVSSRGSVFAKFW
ncbi:hypothetical protein HGRIS_011590 [Hohenbuehelia grisea]|uniref:PX-domain-containing protein n=1 Tax=Hohenbuehelia grisea TaxID=104357 RepID=A0ABR3JWX9_9AGAR